MSDSHPPIPYGLGHFPTVRCDGFYYVDKTRFVYALEPNAAAHPDAPNGYLLELKWLKPSAKDAQVDVLAREATAQLRRYLGDEPLRHRRPHIRYHGLALVYHGWNLAHAEDVEAD